MEALYFLDEIGDMPLNLQAKLLRALEGSGFYRIGGNKLIEVDVRIISATNVPLEQKVLEKSSEKTYLSFKYHVFSHSPTCEKEKTTSYYLPTLLSNN